MWFLKVVLILFALFVGLTFLAAFALVGLYFLNKWRIDARNLWNVYFPPPQPLRPATGPYSLVDRATQTRNSVVQAVQGSVAVLRRAVGYCKNAECEDLNKGVFLMNHSETFHCPRCRKVGSVEPEEGSYTGTSDVFKEVRVEYNFDPVENKYRETAIVRDESLWGANNVYTLRSPLIKTENRALKVAEAILANLNRYGLTDGGIPRTSETVLDFGVSRETFAAQCERLRKELEQSSLAKHAPHS